MISIVICHRNKTLLATVSKSIEDTVGVPYELIVIDNTGNTHTIFSAYNEGVKKSKYEIICFTHEDIIFFTEDWGKKVLSHFGDADTGMIGVAGGTALPVVPAAWWYNLYFAKGAMNYLVSSSKLPGKDLECCNNNPGKDSNKTEVTIMDGLWFCIRKKLFEKISFDQECFSGFHLYDADISMQVGLYAKKYVVYDILMQHVWKGTIDQSYYFELLKFRQKWATRFPLQTGNRDSGFEKDLAWHSLRAILAEMKKQHIPPGIIKGVKDEYLPFLKQKYPSFWYNLYFLSTRFAGDALTLSIFSRIEKLFGYSKAPGFIKMKYPS